MKNSSLQIAGAVQALSQFDRSIRFNLVRFGSKKFGFVCEQTGKQMFLTWDTRLAAAVGIASRYFTCQSCKDCAFVNPKSVAKIAGITMAFDLLLAAGFVKIEGTGVNRRAVVVVAHDLNKNQ